MRPHEEAAFEQSIIRRGAPHAGRNAIFALPTLPRVVLGRRHYAVLALLFAALIVYGCLVPLRPQRLPLAEAIEQFRLVLAQPIGIHSRSDWLANVLLVLPLGFVLMGAVCCDRPRFAWLFFPLAILLCFAFSLAIEFAQLFFPPRVSSVNDVAAQAVGSTLGAFLWLTSGQRLTVLGRRLWTEFGSRNTAGLILPLYLFVLVILETLPFDFTLSPVELYHKFKYGRILLYPVVSPDSGALASADKCFWNAMYFAPLGVLLAYLPDRVWRSGRGWPRILGLGLLAAGFIELLQLFAFSRYCEATDVLTGGFAVLAGWLFALMHRRWHADPMPVRRLMLAAWVAVLMFLEWQPFDFSLSIGSALQRLHQISLLPFLDYYQGNYLHGLDEFIHKMLMFLPLGLLLAPPTPAAAERRDRRFAVLSAAAIALSLEAGQLFLPTRYASLSDVLVACGAAWLGMFVTSHLRLALRAESVLQGRRCEFSR